VTEPRLDLLESLTSEGRTRFEQAAQAVSFDKGAMPILKGDAITGAYIVKRGRLRVTALSAEGREATLYAIAPRRDLRAGHQCAIQGAAISRHRGGGGGYRGSVRARHSVARTVCS
jgi:CRP-like cAMP-binding protein